MNPKTRTERTRLQPLFLLGGILLLALLALLLRCGCNQRGPELPQLNHTEEEARLVCMELIYETIVYKEKRLMDQNGNGVGEYPDLPVLLGWDSERPRLPVEELCTTSRCMKRYENTSYGLTAFRRYLVAIILPDKTEDRENYFWAIAWPLERSLAESHYAFLLDRHGRGYGIKPSPFFGTERAPKQSDVYSGTADGGYSLSPEWKPLYPGQK